MKRYIVIMALLFALSIPATAALDGRGNDHIIHHWRVVGGNSGKLPDGFQLGRNAAGQQVLLSWDSVKMKGPWPTDTTLLGYAGVSAATRIDYNKAMDSDFSNFDRRLMAVIKMLVKEINALRALHSLPAYTSADIKAKLKAKM